MSTFNVNSLHVVAVIIMPGFTFGYLQAKEKGSTAITTSIIIGASPLCLAVLSPVIGYFVSSS